MSSLWSCFFYIHRPVLVAHFKEWCCEDFEGFRNLNLRRARNYNNSIYNPVDREIDR
ncbi:hypothetical protein PISMIDRAFT_672473, partial [Pisolithus microcarpus 441]